MNQMGNFEQRPCQLTEVKKKRTMIIKKLLPLLIALLVGAFWHRAGAETEKLAAAVAAGKVSITFHGKGSSSGDSILATVGR